MIKSAGLSDLSKDGKFKTPHKGAIIILGVGSSLIVGGIVYTASVSSTSDDWATGPLLFVVGSLVDVVGNACLIGGVIHDNHKRKWTLVAPKKSNRIGIQLIIAYNLRSWAEMKYSQLQNRSLGRGSFNLVLSQY